MCGCVNRCGTLLTAEASAQQLATGKKCELQDAFYFLNKSDNNSDDASA